MRLSDIGVGKPSDRHQSVPAVARLDFDPLQVLQSPCSLVILAFVNACRLPSIKAACWPASNGAVVDFADHDAAQIVGIVQGRDLQAGGAFRGRRPGGGTWSKNGLEEGLHIFTVAFKIWSLAKPDSPDAKR
jgi:hypothetical protein